MLKEFKEFAMKGNVIDMAVGIIIGAAFGTVVKSMVADVIMPPVGIMLGGVDFANLAWTVQEASGDQAAVLVKYGVFINNLISFVTVAFCVFMLVKSMNKMKKAPAPADPTTKDCGKCFSSISIKATRCPNCTSELSA